MFNQHNQDDSYENKIVIDGMEINDSMSGTSYYNFNYEAMEEIDIKTAGASAEYGNARSSFMNIVTKSGGNSFKGSAFVQVRPESFNWTNVTTGSPSATSYIEPNITLSGPILQDKLWFMGSYKYNNEDYVYPDTIVLKKIVRETRGHMPYFKLTYQPTPKHTFSAIYQNDFNKIDPAAFPNTVYSTLDSAYRGERGGPMYSLTWRWLISDSLFFNFVGGYQHKPRSNYSHTQSPLYTYTERFQAGSALLYDKGYGEEYFSVRDNILFSGNLTYLVSDLAGTGSHEFKTGVDIRPYQYANWTRKYNEDALGFYQYSYGLDYASYGLTQPYVYRGYQRKAPAGANQSEYTNAANCTSQNFYIQDNWLVSKNLSLQLGLRVEHQRNDQYWRDEMDPSLEAIYSGIRSNVILEGTGLAPRFGLTYNWDKVGVFKLHYGRYLRIRRHRRLLRRIPVHGHRPIPDAHGRHRPRPRGHDALFRSGRPPERRLQQGPEAGVQRRVRPLLRAGAPLEPRLRDDLHLPPDLPVQYGRGQRRLQGRGLRRPPLPRLRRDPDENLVRRRRPALEVRLQGAPLQPQAELQRQMGLHGQLFADVAELLPARLGHLRPQAVRLREARAI